MCFADRKCTPIYYEIGDWMYLFINPSISSAIKSHKLSPRYYGSGMITKKIEEVAYKLDLRANIPTGATL